MNITESLGLWARRLPGRVLRRGLLGVAPVVVLARLTSDPADLGPWLAALVLVLVVTAVWLVTELVAVRLWLVLVPVASSLAVVVRGALVLAGPAVAYLVGRAVVPGGVPDAAWPLLVLPVVGAVVHLADLARVQPPHVHAVCVPVDSSGEPWVAQAGRRVTLTDRAGRTHRVRLAGSAFALERSLPTWGRPLLAAAGSGGVVALVDVPGGEVVTAHQAAVGPVRHLRAANLSGRPAIAAAGEGGRIAIWRVPRPVVGAETASAGEDHVLCVGHAGGVSGLAWFGTAGEDDVLLSTGADRMLRVWDPVTGDQVVSHAVPGLDVGIPRGLCRVRVDRRHLVAVGGDDGAVRLVDPASGELVRRLEVEHGAAMLPVLAARGGAVHALCAVVTPEGSFLAAGGDFPGVQLWDLGTGRLHHWVGWDGALDMKPRCGWVRSLAVRDGDGGPELLTAGYDERVGVFALGPALALDPR